MKDFQVIISHEVSKTQLGILYDPSTNWFGLLCPSCKAGEIIYKNHKSIEMICTECRVVFQGFDKINSYFLNYFYGWKQWIRGNEDNIAGWIENWTGLEDVEVVVNW